MTLAALIMASLALIVAIAAFFVRKRTVIEYRNDLRLSTIKKINQIEADIRTLDKQKPTLIKDGKVRKFLDDEGHVFGRHIIEKK